jgi:O-antigen/teichoic acid export membrane protein
MSDSSREEIGVIKEPKAAMSSLPQQKSLRQTLIIYAGGNSVATGLQMLGGFFATRFVTPAVLGTFQGFMLFTEYLPPIGLGVFYGLDRELPYHYGKRDVQRVERLVASAQACAFFLGSASFLAFLALALSSALSGNWESAVGWSMDAVTAFLLFFSKNYLECLHRTHHNFTTLSKVLLLRSVVSILFLALVWFFQFYGLCLRATAMVLAGSIALWRFRPLQVPFRLKISDVWHLIKVGLPIMAVVQLSSLWFVVNRTLILTFMGRRELGLYALYPMMFPALNLLPMAVGQVIYPRVTEMYGRHGNLREITRYATKPLALLLLLMIPVIAMLWLLLPAVVELLLPRYVEGVPAACWAALDILIICLMQIRVVFFTIQRQFLYCAGILAGIAVNVLVLLWLTRETVYLEAFPQSLVAGRVVYISICYAVLYYLCRREAAMQKANSADREIM